MEGEGEKQGLGFSGFERADDSQNQGRPVSCHEALKKVNTEQRTTFTRLIKSTHLNRPVYNTCIQKSMYISHCSLLPTSPWFISIQNEECIKSQERMDGQQERNKTQNDK